MCRSLTLLIGPRWRTSSQGKATQFRARGSVRLAGPAWGNDEAGREGEGEQGPPEYP